jgi:hypothetical protein
MLAAFLVVSFFDLYVIAQMPAPAEEAAICQLAGDEDNGIIPKLSEVAVKRAPSLGGVGAAVQKVFAPVCSPLAAGQWTLLLVAYVALLLFNLFYDYKKTPGLRWRFETLLAVFTLGAWFWLDTCRDFVWFPLEIIKLSLLIYFFYYYYKTQPVVQEEYSKV